MYEKTSLQQMQLHDIKYITKHMQLHINIQNMGPRQTFQKQMSEI